MLPVSADFHRRRVLVAVLVTVPFRVACSTTVNTFHRQHDLSSTASLERAQPKTVAERGQWTCIDVGKTDPPPFGQKVDLAFAVELIRKPTQ